MVELEKAVFEDAAAFAAMEQAPDTKEYILPYSKCEHVRKMGDASMMYLRILESKELKGFIILALEPGGQGVEFRRIVITSKGCGIGQSAIRAMEHFCRIALGRTRIWLDVFEHNPKGRHIYEKLGYEKFGEDNSEGKLLLLYRKFL